MQLIRGFNIGLYIGMTILVWLKITLYFLIAKQFGVYLRMIFHMMKLILNFVIIIAAWMMCNALIFY